METQNTVDSQDLPKQVSDAAWNSILPFLIEDYSYEYVIGDKAYDSDAFIAEITSRDAITVIPPRKGRTEPRAYDETLYKRRNLIERFFGWLKQYIVGSRRATIN